MCSVIVSFGFSTPNAVLNVQIPVFILVLFGRVFVPIDERSIDAQIRGTLKDTEKNETAYTRMRN